MFADILQKIQDRLERPIDNEEGVVYLLTEVRKIIEDKAHKPDPFLPSLWLYCNWALHVNLG